MPAKMYGIGLSPCVEPFKVVLSDFDGADIVSELKDEISAILESGLVDYSPIPVYIMTGVLGAIRVETLILYIYGGVPMLLDAHCGIEGGSLRDGRLSSGSSFMGRMFSEGNNMVYSLGYVDSMSSVYDYAVKHTRTTPLVKNELISESTAAMYISSNSDTVVPVGKIQRLGGSMYDVYGFSASESALIRTDKDFIGGEPYNENGIRKGKYEVILYGGDPDIVPVGELCDMYGDVFTVWVPNNAGYIECATSMLRYGDLPISDLYVDYDDLSDAYAMYAAKLLSDEEEADEAESEDDVPFFDYEEFYEE